MQGRRTQVRPERRVPLRYAPESALARNPCFVPWPRDQSIIISGISPSDSHRPSHGRSPGRHYLSPDALVVLILEKDRADNHCDERNHDWDRQSGVDVSGARNQASRDDRKEPAEPAVANM